MLYLVFTKASADIMEHVHMEAPEMSEMACPPDQLPSSSLTIPEKNNSVSVSVPLHIGKSSSVDIIPFNNTACIWGWKQQKELAMLVPLAKLVTLEHTMLTVQLGRSDLLLQILKHIKLPWLFSPQSCRWRTLRAVCAVELLDRHRTSHHLLAATHPSPLMAVHSKHICTHYWDISVEQLDFGLAVESCHLMWQDKPLNVGPAFGNMTRSSSMERIKLYW